MSKYNEELVEEILQMVEADFYTVTQICRMLGVSRKTFYEWRDTKPEFKKALDEAVKHRDEILLMIARTSFKKRLEGYTTVEEKYNYVPSKSNPSEMILKSKTLKKKECPPDLRAIKMMMDRADKHLQEETAPEKAPWIINVQSEEAAEQLRILYRNGGESGGQSKNFDDVGDYKTVEIEVAEEAVSDENVEQADELTEEATTIKKTKQIQIKHDPRANITIVKGGGSDFIPPGYLYRG